MDTVITFPLISNKHNFTIDVNLCCCYVIVLQIYAWHFFMNTWKMFIQFYCALKKSSDPSAANNFVFKLISLSSKIIFPIETKYEFPLFLQCADCSRIFFFSSKTGNWTTWQAIYLPSSFKNFAETRSSFDYFCLQKA